MWSNPKAAPHDSASDDVDKADAAPAAARLLAPDLARGAMLLLIVLAHAPFYLTGTGAGPVGNPAGGTVADSLVRLVTIVGVDSRAYPMFAALFGYGMVMLLTRRKAAGVSEPEARTMLRRRGRWLIVFGLFHALLVTPVEILGAYGVAVLLVGWMLFRPEKTLVIAAAALTAMYSVTLLGYALFESAAAAAEPGADAELALGLMGYGLADMVFRVIGWLIAVGSNLLVFPVLVPMLLGALAARHKLLEDPARHRALLRRLVAVGLPTSILGALPLVLIETGVLSADVAWAAIWLHVLTGVAGGLAYTAIFGLLGAKLQDRPFAPARVLAAAGKRSLTCYLLQSALLVGLLSQTFLGLGAHVNSAGAALAAVGAWSGGLLAANLLEKAGRPGPAEALLRRMVNRKVKKR